jgi:hypothetical protein
VSPGPSGMNAAPGRAHAWAELGIIGIGRGCISTGGDGPENYGPVPIVRSSV